MIYFFALELWIIIDIIRISFEIYTSFLIKRFSHIDNNIFIIKYYKYLLYKKKTRFKYLIFHNYNAMLT